MGTSLEAMAERRNVQEAARTDLDARQSVMRHGTDLLLMLRRQTGICHQAIAQAKDIEDAELLVEGWRCVFEEEAYAGMGLTVDLTHSGMGKSDQRDVMEALKAGKLDVIVQVGGVPLMGRCIETDHGKL